MEFFYQDENYNYKMFITMCLKNLVDTFMFSLIINNLNNVRINISIKISDK
jgi:hypothetical protein